VCAARQICFAVVIAGVNKFWRLLRKLWICFIARRCRLTGVQ